MPTTIWSTLFLATAAAALAVIFSTSRQTVLAKEKPEEVGRWESEGGNVPAANFSVQQAEQARNFAEI